MDNKDIYMSDQSSRSLYWSVLEYLWYIGTGVFANKY